MKKQIISLFLLISSLFVQAQKTEFASYSYSNEVVAIDKKYANEEEIMLEKHIKNEFVAEPNNFYEILLVHEKKLINSDVAIERNNKVYLPFQLDDDLLVNKMRVLLKNGKIIELKESDIKEEIDEQTKQKYHYFAVNGLEKGAIIERIYQIKRFPDVTGNDYTMQSYFPILKTSVEVIFPSILVFSSASYNGFPEAEFKENSYPEKNSLYVEGRHIPAFPTNEKYSNPVKHIQRFAYKLNENKVTGVRNLFNHQDFSKNLFDSYNKALTKDEKKELERFLKGMQQPTNQRELIFAIENYIKKNIQYNKYFGANENLKDALKNKQANLFHLAKLYVQIFNHFNINHEIVLTTERFKKVFDPSFESEMNFQDLLFYFPSEDFYIEPAAFIYRAPLFDDQFAGNHGLFISSKEFGGIKTSIAKVKTIEFPKNQQLQTMTIDVDFTEDITQPKMVSKIKFNGHEAINFQPYKDLLDPSDYNEWLEMIAKNYTHNSTVEHFEAENEGLEAVGKKQFALNITANVGDLVSKAGNNYVFKVGEVIGRQAELYEDKERVLPVELENPHAYDRTITIKLPEEYTVKNPEAFKMNFEIKQDGKLIGGFTSDYQLKGNQLIVENKEWYDFVEIPASMYPQFQKTINAAADFNKISIILEKK